MVHYLQDVILLSSDVQYLESWSQSFVTDLPEQWDCNMYRPVSIQEWYDSSYRLNIYSYICLSRRHTWYGRNDKCMYVELLWPFSTEKSTTTNCMEHKFLFVFYTYDLFGNVVNCSRIYTSYVGMISKLERLWRQAVVLWLEVTSRMLPMGVEKKKYETLYIAGFWGADGTRDFLEWESGLPLTRPRRAVKSPNVADIWPTKQVSGLLSNLTLPSVHWVTRIQCIHIPCLLKTSFVLFPQMPVSHQWCIPFIFCTDTVYPYLISHRLLLCRNFNP